MQNTIFKQYLRYYRKNSIRIYLIKVFISDIVKFIIDSMSKEFSIIVSLDANKNVYKGKLQKLFKEISLVETSKLFLDKLPPTTYYK